LAGYDKLYHYWKPRLLWIMGTNSLLHHIKLMLKNIQGVTRQLKDNMFRWPIIDLELSHGVLFVTYVNILYSVTRIFFCGRQWGSISYLGDIYCAKIEQ
jgi:hypothetical protein